MASRIAPATKEELKRAKHISPRDIFPKGVLKIIDEAELGGFRVIYRQPIHKSVGILMPSTNVLNWDFNPRSLDLFDDYSNQRELRDAALYAGLAAQSILDGLAY